MEEFDKKFYFSEKFESNLAKEYHRMHQALFHDKNIVKISKRDRQAMYRMFPVMFSSALLFAVFDIKRIKAGLRKRRVYG